LTVALVGAKAKWSDKKLMLVLCAVMLVLILGISVLAPQSQANDPRPTTFNSGPQGAKAAYLLLKKMGRTSLRWEKPLTELSDMNAGETTLVLAEPVFSPTDEEELRAEVKEFLERGGRVLATGAMGAELLPDGKVKAPGIVQTELCYTTPEGPGALAHAGSVEMTESGQWAAGGARFRVEQRCGADAVVVQYAVGKGEAVWWSSATAMTNAGLKHDADLALFLDSVGANASGGRSVVFDESLHAATKSLWDAAKGLPLGWLSLQTGLVGLLLVLSFSRRSGPMRTPVEMPRSSPVEFAESMGDLYAKGEATVAAVDAAKRRLLRVLVKEAGLLQTTVDAGPEAISEALRVRLGGDWSGLEKDLKAAQATADERLKGRSALVLVRAMEEDVESVRTKLRPVAAASI
jgi:hypothetical protein